jgi:hypothetical protein
MNRSRLTSRLAAAVLALPFVALTTVVHAQTLSSESANLSGVNENLPVISPGTGTFLIRAHALQHARKSCMHPCWLPLCSIAPYH